MSKENTDNKNNSQNTQKHQNQDNKNNSKWQQKHPSKQPEESVIQDNNSNNSDQQSKDSSKIDIEANLKTEIATLNEKNLRLLAELDNLRRRNKEDLEKASKYAISNFVGDLVATVENFFLANDHAPREEIAKNDALKNYAQAIDMTQKEIVKTLEKYGVKRIYPLNSQFDHNFHEALSQIESDKEEGTVVQVIQAGYQIGDRLLRPALVGVAKNKSN